MFHVKDAKCADVVRDHLKGRIDDLRRIWDAQRSEDVKTADDAREEFDNYALSFDYVPVGTFKDQDEGYFRYQISWGGPSDEFRFFVGPEFVPSRIEYWFMDWFDGAKIILSGRNLDLLREIFDDFKDCGTVQAQFDAATRG